MAALSDYLEIALLDWFRGTAVPAPPANIYVALFTTAPSDSGGGVEVFGGAYARVTVPVEAASWSEPTASGFISNQTEWAFPDATSPWGEVTHFGIFDAVTGGNLLVHGALAESKDVDIGDIVRFAPGNATITVG